MITESDSAHEYLDMAMNAAELDRAYFAVQPDDNAEFLIVLGLLFKGMEFFSSRSARASFISSISTAKLDFLRS